MLRRETGVFGSSVPLSVADSNPAMNVTKRPSSEMLAGLSLTSMEPGGTAVISKEMQC